MDTITLPDFDVAVIGGGASGIYTAWRMLLDGPGQSPQLKKWRDQRGELKIAVFEGSERIGGRLLSAVSPALPGVICEIGGMRFVSSQILVSSLVENKLNLPHHEQAVTESSNILLLRGKQLRVSDLSDPEKLPYNFAPEEIDWLNADVNPKNTADNFLGYAVKKLFPDIDKYVGKNLRKYLESQQVDGIPLYKHGFWNLVATQLSHEAYQIAVTTIGYDCLGYNTNAVDAICEYFDFTPDVKYYLLNDGYDAVIWTLQQEFEKGGGKVYTGRRLEGFDESAMQDGSPIVSLQFAGEDEVRSARAIVLAMPRRSIELLAQRGPVLDPSRAPHVRFMMNAVEPVNLYKMFIEYDQPWWQKEGVSMGRSLTDIPIRQCYYWSGADQNRDASKENDPALLMVYNDALSSDFWGGLRYIPLGAGDVKIQDQPQSYQRKEKAVSASEDNDGWTNRLGENWKNCKAPKAMVKEMHRQLQILHNVSGVPEPIDAAFMDWGDDPYGGAVHFWNPGYESSTILQEMIQPVKNFPCFICGEAYSTNQTWVEGALQTAELVLRKFGIAEPEWINKKATNENTENNRHRMVGA